MAISRLVNSLKGVSSRLLREEDAAQVNSAGLRERFWSPSYFAGSCGGGPLSDIKNYIADQKHPN